ncbi:hypothetical protein HDU76_004992 [Blyttiomyces sp. JEL0837]|nr:hypothetical protein HDU76_004992 [Blyttiomyces sp. JEL0837]
MQGQSDPPKSSPWWSILVGKTKWKWFSSTSASSSSASSETANLPSTQILSQESYTTAKPSNSSQSSTLATSAPPPSPSILSWLSFANSTTANTSTSATQSSSHAPISDRVDGPGSNPIADDSDKISGGNKAKTPAKGIKKRKRIDEDGSNLNSDRKHCANCKTKATPRQRTHGSDRPDTNNRACESEGSKTDSIDTPEKKVEVEEMPVKKKRRKSSVQHSVPTPKNDVKDVKMSTKKIRKSYVMDSADTPRNEATSVEMTIKKTKSRGPKQCANCETKKTPLCHGRHKPLAGADMEEAPVSDVDSDSDATDIVGEGYVEVPVEETTREKTMQDIPRSMFEDSGYMDQTDADSETIDVARVELPVKDTANNRNTPPLVNYPQTPDQPCENCGIDYTSCWRRGPGNCPSKCTALNDRLMYAAPDGNLRRNYRHKLLILSLFIMKTILSWSLLIGLGLFMHVVVLNKLATMSTSSSASPSSTSFFSWFSFQTTSNTAAAPTSPSPNDSNIPKVSKATEDGLSDLNRGADIPSVHDKVWENPYYPLPGPPQTQEEKDLLSLYIRKEREATKAGIQAKLTNESELAGGDMDKIARSNCADIRFDLTKCLRSSNSTWIGTPNLCNELRDKFSECLGLQKQYLKELGFTSLSSGTTLREKMLLAERADDMYLKEMRRREKEATKKNSEAV